MLEVQIEVRVNYTTRVASQTETPDQGSREMGSTLNRAAMILAAVATCGVFPQPLQAKPKQVAHPLDGKWCSPGKADYIDTKYTGRKEWKEFYFGNQKGFVSSGKILSSTGGLYHIQPGGESGTKYIFTVSDDTLEIDRKWWANQHTKHRYVRCTAAQIAEIEAAIGSPTTPDILLGTWCSVKDNSTLRYRDLKESAIKSEHYISDALYGTDGSKNSYKISREGPRTFQFFNNYRYRRWYLAPGDVLYSLSREDDLLDGLMKPAYNRCQDSLHNELKSAYAEKMNNLRMQGIMMGLAMATPINANRARASAGLSATGWVPPYPTTLSALAGAGAASAASGHNATMAGSASIASGAQGSTQGRPPVNATFNCHSFSKLGTTGEFIHNNCGQTLTFWICDEPLCKSGSNGAVTVGAGSKTTMGMGANSKHYLACPPNYSLEESTARCTYMGG